MHRGTDSVLCGLDRLQYKKETLLEINNYIKLNLKISPESEMTIVKAMLTMEEDHSNIIGVKNFSDVNCVGELDEDGVYWISGGAETLISQELNELTEEELLKIELVLPHTSRRNHEYRVASLLWGKVEASVRVLK